MSDPIRILVAEDHLVARVGVTTIVNMQSDMKVVAEASNGQQAIEMFRKHLPDVTLLDLRMPVIGGVEAAVLIRSEFPDARLIALTTYGGDEDIRRALHAGVQAYLTKDVLHDELLKAIRAVGEYLRRHNLTVTAFYTSNVEQYLFQGDGWKRFFGNVAALPLDPTSTFIRAYFNNMGFRYPVTAPGVRSATLLDPIGEEVEAFNEGRIQSYYDIVERSQAGR